MSSWGSVVSGTCTSRMLIADRGGIVGAVGVGVLEAISSDDSCSSWARMMTIGEERQCLNMFHSLGMSSSRKSLSNM